MTESDLFTLLSENVDKLNEDIRLKRLSLALIGHEDGLAIQTRTVNSGDGTNIHIKRT